MRIVVAAWERGQVGKHWKGGARKRQFCRAEQGEREAEAEARSGLGCKLGKRRRTRLGWAGLGAAKTSKAQRADLCMRSASGPTLRAGSGGGIKLYKGAVSRREQFRG